MRHRQDSVLGRVLALLCAALATAQPSGSSTMCHCRMLSCAARMSVSWCLDPRNSTLTLEVAARGQGWMGLGFAPGSGTSMANADLTMAWIPSLSSPAAGRVRDMTGAAVNGRPTPDAPDARRASTFISSAYNSTSGIMMVRWQRPLRTGDARDVAIEPGRAGNVLWAFAPDAAAVAASDGSMMRQHDADKRGVVQIDFGGHSSCDAACPGDAPTRYSVMRPRCLGNGWTPSEAAGDRDDGAARPRVATTVTRAISVPTQVPVSSAAASSASMSMPSVNLSRLSMPSSAALDAVSRPMLRSPDGVHGVVWSIDGAAQVAYFQMATRVRNGWAGLGFNPRGATMSGSDIVVGIAAPAAAGARTCAGLGACASCCSATLSHHHAMARSMPSLGPADGGASDAVLLNATVTATGHTIITFARALARIPGIHTQPTALRRLGGAANVTRVTTFLVWAYGSTPMLSMHDASGGSAAAVTLAADVTGSVSALVYTSQSSLYALHGAGMVLAFWACMLVGVWLPVFRDVLPGCTRPAMSSAASTAKGASTAPKSSAAPSLDGASCLSRFHAKERWFVGHAYLQTSAMLAIVVALISITAAKLARPGGRLLELDSYHSRVGVSAVVLAGLQFALGMLRPPPGDSPRRRGWLLAHRIVAAVTLVIGSAAIFLGIQRAGLSAKSALIPAALHVVCYLLATVTAGTSLACFTRKNALASTLASASSEGEHDGEAAEPRITVKPVNVSISNGAPSSATPSHAAADTSHVKTDAGATSAAYAKSAASVVHCLPHVALAAGAVAMAMTVLALVGIIGVAGTSNGIVITAEILPFTAPEPSRLPQFVTVNMTMNVTETQYTYVDKYPGGTRDLCFGVQNFTVPTTPTSYVCRGFALPRNVNLSALEFEMLVDNAAVVHHAVAFMTWMDFTNVPEGFRDLGRGNFECFNIRPPFGGVLFAWAVGMELFKLPTGMGIRVGVPDNLTQYDYSSLSHGVPFITMQFHYNNPSGTAGLIDSSVLRIRVTDDIPPIDAGLLWAGVSPDEDAGPAATIPPTNRTYGHQNEFTFPQGFPAARTINPLMTDYSAFAVFYHMHLIGQRIWTETIRNGAPVVNPFTGDRQLTTDNAYSFEMQRLAPLYNATLRPGDLLRTRCVHLNSREYGALVGNTVAAAGLPVVPGERTTEEMCMAFLMYAPRVPGWHGVVLGGSSSFCGIDGLPACETVT